MGGWYWGGTDDSLAIRSIHGSIDAGICGIDTAPIYGCGHSEEVVGQAIFDRRDKVVLMTKVGLRWDCEEGAFFFAMSPEEGGHQVFRNLRSDSIRQEVENSLRRLQNRLHRCFAVSLARSKYPVEVPCRLWLNYIVKENSRCRCLKFQCGFVDQKSTGFGRKWRFHWQSSTPLFFVASRN